jgi:hypothetical protein
MPIVGKETSRENGKILLENPAYLSVNQRQTGFSFAPVQFIEKGFRLYESGLTGDGPMPKLVRQSYEEWCKQEGE